jgi:hypothetical protein
MPELSRFFGIVIRMFVEAGGQHHRSGALARPWLERFARAGVNALRDRVQLGSRSELRATLRPGSLMPVLN